MNKYFRLILVVLCSLSLVGILEFSGIHLDLIGGAIIFLFVVICMILFIIARSFSSLKLLHKGEYSKAIEGFKKNMKKYGNSTKIVNAMLYNISVCNYRKGDF